MDFDERFKLLADQIESFVRDGRVFVEVEILEEMNILLEQLGAMTWSAWTQREKQLWLLMIDYYRGFTDMLIKKHAADLVPDSPGDLK